MRVGNELGGSLRVGNELGSLGVLGVWHLLSGNLGVRDALRVYGLTLLHFRLRVGDYLGGSLGVLGIGEGLGGDL